MPRKADPDKLATSARRLGTEDLKRLIEDLQAELAEREQATQDQDGGLADGWRPEYRKCGKQSCWCAGAEQGHGPYFYRSVRKGERIVKEYQSKPRTKAKAKYPRLKAKPPGLGNITS